METRSDLIPIGAFAARTQLSIKALRLYDKLELLTPAHIDPDSGYRYYAPDQVRQAKLIFLMRRMEMPLAAIRHVLQATDSEAGGMLQDHQRDFECRLERNRRLLRDLLALLANEEITMNFEVRIERVPALTIAGIKKNVKIDGLEDHIHQSIGALQDGAGNRIAGDFFGIYHGEVNEQSDGPMEVCAPLSEATPITGAAIRHLPETDAAIVDVPADQCHFPAILGAYETAFSWLKAQGKTCADAPREVWLCDLDDMRMRIIIPFT
jgi:DNA-binding transcriptional MerR regulator